MCEPVETIIPINDEAGPSQCSRNSQRVETRPFLFYFFLHRASKHLEYLQLVKWPLNNVNSFSFCES